MQDLLADIWLTIERDLTIVFVTHDIPEAVYLADEIWIMSSNPQVRLLKEFMFLFL